MPEMRDTDPQSSFRGKLLLHVGGAAGGSVLKSAYLFACLFLTTHLLYFAYLNSQDLT